VGRLQLPAQRVGSVMVSAVKSTLFCVGNSNLYWHGVSSPVQGILVAAIWTTDCTTLPKFMPT
jgi:hypothetical protein